MPRLNSKGEWCSGIGGAGVSINGRMVAENAGLACWLDDERAIFQIGSQLYTCTVNGQPEKIDDLGANMLAAGHNVYMARFNGILRIVWSKDQVEMFPGDYVGDVGPDGSVIRVSADGKVDGQVVYELQALGGGAWSGLSTGWRPIASPGFPPVATVAGPVYNLRQRGLYCCYLIPDGRFVVAYTGVSKGKVLARDLKGAFRPDLTLVDGKIHVAFSTTEGERPGDIQRFIVDPSELTEMLKADGQPVPVPTPTPTPVPTPVPEPEKPVDYPFPEGYDPLPKLKAVRAKFPTPLGDRHGAFLVACCEAVGYGAGLMKKDGGTFVTLANGAKVSQDWMCFPNFVGLDFVNDGENSAGVTWGEARPNNPGQYLDVSDLFGSTPVPVPVPVPEQPPVSGDFIKFTTAKLIALESRLAKLEGKPEPSSSDEFARGKLGEHDKAFEALGSQLSAIGPADKLARKGDPVSVKVPILGTARGSIG